MPRDLPGGLVVDLSTVIAFSDAIDAVEAAWAKVPPAARPGLSRLIWFHPDGGMVAYRAPDPEQAQGIAETTEPGRNG